MSEVALGAIVLDMKSTFLTVDDPVIATPVFDESNSQPEPELDAGVFPTQPVEITTTTGPAGQRQQLVVATGQYRSEDGRQRLDDQLHLVVYYADPDNPDVTPPTIGAVQSSITAGVLTVSLTAGAAPGNGVDRGLPARGRESRGRCNGRLARSGPGPCSRARTGGPVRWC